MNIRYTRQDIIFEVELARLRSRAHIDDAVKTLYDLLPVLPTMEGRTFVTELIGQLETIERKLTEFPKLGEEAK